MHMVKATLPKLQPKAESEGPVHTTVYVNRQELVGEQGESPNVSHSNRNQSAFLSCHRYTVEKGEKRT
jgi:hypothetical protein